MAAAAAELTAQTWSIIEHFQQTRGTQQRPRTAGQGRNRAAGTTNSVSPVLADTSVTSVPREVSGQVEIELRKLLG